jgi:peroxiredoxin Q/BCP
MGDKMKSLKSLMLLISLVGVIMAGEKLNKGDTAPDFEMQDGQGKLHRLADYKGKTVVLYFYPKDDTPGCTSEACNLRDNFDALTEMGIVVLGVSTDDQESHQEFSKKYKLPFPLLADTAGAVCKAYGADGGLTRFYTAKRITYLIDGEGKILHRFDDVNTSDHTAQILAVLNKE